MISSPSFSDLTPKQRALMTVAVTSDNPAVIDALQRLFVLVELTHAGEVARVVDNEFDQCLAIVTRDDDVAVGIINRGDIASYDGSLTKKQIDGFMEHLKGHYLYFADVMEADISDKIDDWRSEVDGTKA